MKTQNIEQTVLIRAKPADVYDAFMNAKIHREFTGFSAEIDNKVGGKFITCGGRNFGYTLHLEPGKRIIQAWRQKDFPDNSYSIIDIRFAKTKEGYTRLNFLHVGTPQETSKWLIPGWKSTYWKPLKAYLEKGIIQPFQD